MTITEVKNLVIYGNRRIDNLSDWWKHQRAYHSIANFETRLREHWFLIVWFVLIAIFDGISTEMGLSLGFTEKNNFQQMVQTHSLFLSSGLEIVGYSLIAVLFIYAGSIKLGYFISLFAYTIGPAFNVALILLVNMGKVVPY